MSEQPGKGEIRERLSAIFDGRPVYWADRQWALSLCGYSVSDLADAAFVNRNTASYAVQGRHVGRAGRKLAELTGIPLDRLYPCHRIYRIRPDEGGEAMAA